MIKEEKTYTRIAVFILRLEIKEGFHESRRNEGD